MTPSQVLELLASRFPELPVLSPDDEVAAAEPYYSYERFADEVRNRRDDRGFFMRACSFINELADSGDELLEEVLVLSVLETVAEDPALAKDMRGCLSVKANSFLQGVETEF
jgi:hypothetical protein